jgi:hypothetical protein
VRYLLRYAEKRQRMGQTGQAFVREHFLLTRNIRDYLSMLLLLNEPEPKVSGLLAELRTSDFGARGNGSGARSEAANSVGTE